MTNTTIEEPRSLASGEPVIHTPSQSRREFLTLLGSGVAAATLAGCTNKNGSRTADSVGGASGAAFVQPDALTSADGRLEVTLVAEARSVPYGSGTRGAYTYNGTTPGPTLRVRPGDRLVVRLQNQLDTVTNLHTHGLHVSPAGDADNIFVTVAPGTEHTYTYDIPADHRSGLFWYHPHAHGHVADQVAGGLAGAIVVVDDIDSADPIMTSTERIWVLSDPPITSGTPTSAVSQMARMLGREGDAVLVNGLDRPDLATTAGTIERWRLVNASASRYYRLALEGHQLHVIASDGGRLGAPVTAAEVLLAPGERTELLVTPTQTGTFWLRALAYDRGGLGMGGGMMGGNAPSTSEVRLTSMTVSGSANAATLPASLATIPAIDPAQITSKRTLTLAMGSGSGGMGGGSMMSFTIDGNTFDPARTDISIAAGTTELWNIRNTSPMDHPFHLHVWPFRIIDGPPTSGWKDTVNVPANSSVNIAVTFADITGTTVYHCHILDHEDLGMMGIIDVTA